MYVRDANLDAGVFISAEPRGLTIGRRFHRSAKLRAPGQLKRLCPSGNRHHIRERLPCRETGARFCGWSQRKPHEFRGNPGERAEFLATGDVRPGAKNVVLERLDLREDACVEPAGGEGRDLAAWGERADARTGGGIECPCPPDLKRHQGRKLLAGPSGKDRFGIATEGRDLVERQIKPAAGSV